MLDDSHEIPFTITDLKQYHYCPRIFYYHACLPDIRPVTYKMQAGIDAHDTERKRAARRSFAMYQTLNGERFFDVSVQSSVLGLSGQLDEMIQTPHELIPIDYKLARQAGHHFKIQLAAYALLLEENYALPVKRGFLYLIPARKAVEVKITPRLRSQVQQAINEMRNIALQEQITAPTSWRQRCPDCEFRRFCNDV